MPGFASKVVSAFSAVAVFARQRIAGHLRRVGGFAVILAVFVVAVWGLNTAPAFKHLPADDLESDTRLPAAGSEFLALTDPPALLAPGSLALSDPPPLPDLEPQALSAPSVSPDPEPSASSEPPPVSASEVNHVSSLLESHRARAVYSGTVKGKKRTKVEFLTQKGTVSDVYSEEALSRDGWRLSINLNKRTALLRNSEKAYTIPLVDNSQPKKSYAKKTKQKPKTRVASRSKLMSTGDHVGVTYVKLPKR